MAYNTIKIKKYSDVIEEYDAGAGITPGHFVELASTGKVVVNAAAGSYTLPMVALEDELQGKGITDAYVLNDKVQVWIPYRGDMVYALLAAGESVSIGDEVYVDADGEVVAVGSALQNPVGVAVEAVDADSGSASRVVIRIV